MFAKLPGKSFGCLFLAGRAAKRKLAADEEIH
jgi:hypothetical protein